jgi:two-component system sensor histidine kinase PilS (NtrC family)
MLKSDLSVDDLMLSDPEQIRQVIWNILLNAADALPERGFLHITTRKVKGEGPDGLMQDMIEIVFRDSGKGFSEKALVHMFSPFFTTKEGGSGLGLAMVKQIVEGLKGNISGRNHPEGGAEIIVRLKVQ